MSTLKRNTLPSDSGPAAGTLSETAEDTLKLIARLPAPEGLAERIQAGLRVASFSAFNPAPARILRWPIAGRLDHVWMHSNWVRAAAAAAIVFVVAGGGWGIYSRVAPVPQQKGIALPHAAAPGGFSGAAAMRTPQTLNGPAAVRPAVVHPAPAPQAGKPGGKGLPASPHGKSAAGSKAAVQPNAPSAK